MELTNMPFNEFIVKNRPDYNYAFEYGRYFTPKDIFGFGEFMKMPFGKVKDMQYYFSDVVNWAFLLNFVHEETGISKLELGSISIFEWVKFRNWIKQGVKAINKLEEQLRYEGTPDDEASGINNLAKFNVFIQIDELAHGKIWMHDTIKEKVPYEIGFIKLLKDKEVNEYQRERMKIKS